MDVAITGSHGLVGTALADSLRRDGHRVVPIVRSPGVDGTVHWDIEAGAIDRVGLEGLDGVVHLAGEGIASKPWTEAQRARIHDSRTDGTTLLAGVLAGLAHPPAALISGSAIGYYGDRGDEVLTERSGPGTDFLAEVCVDWEQAAAAASDAGIRTALVRTGIVLDAEGGALAKQLLPFKLGLGAKAGRGDQWFSWISLEDQVAAIRHCLDHDTVRGPVNLTAPNPVTNAEFTDAVGDTLGRPTFLTIPRLVHRLPFGLGGLADSLLFTSARVMPTALEDTGFVFTHPSLDLALDAVLT